MLSCEFCEISKSTFFTEHLWTSASVVITVCLITDAYKLHRVYLCLKKENLLSKSQKELFGESFNSENLDFENPTKMVLQKERAKNQLFRGRPPFQRGRDIGRKQTQRQFLVQTKNLEQNFITSAGKQPYVFP